MSRKVNFGKNGQGYETAKISIRNSELRLIKVNKAEPYITIKYDEEINSLIISKE